jgi:hypothetical protein
MLWRMLNAGATIVGAQWPDFGHDLMSKMVGLLEAKREWGANYSFLKKREAACVSSVAIGSPR